jgi:hypothetical protein
MRPGWLTFGFPRVSGKIVSWVLNVDLLVQVYSGPETDSGIRK